jgi:hypothetical protein
MLQLQPLSRPARSGVRCCSSAQKGETFGPSRLRRLILLRHGDHAEAPGQRDHDRPLTSVGKEQGRQTAQKLKGVCRGMQSGGQMVGVVTTRESTSGCHILPWVQSLEAGSQTWSLQAMQSAPRKPWTRCAQCSPPLPTLTPISVSCGRDGCPSTQGLFPLWLLLTSATAAMSRPQACT